MGTSEPEGKLLRLFSSAEIQKLGEKVISFASGGGLTQIQFKGWWRGELRWARNNVSLSSDTRSYEITITRNLYRSSGTVTINRFDDSLVRHAVAMAEKYAEYNRKAPLPVHDPVPVGHLPTPDTAIWSDSTYMSEVEDRGRLVSTLSSKAGEAGMLTAGYLEMRASESMFLLDDPANEYELMQDYDPEDSFTRNTQAQCSITVRHPRGLGSGWAGTSGYDWSVLNAQAVSDIALEKCLASLNPVAIEPGRYNVILEPQSVMVFTDALINSLDRLHAESGNSTFSLQLDSGIGMWRTKLGLKVLDDRVTIGHYPEHPQLGVVPTAGLTDVKWVTNGVLMALDHTRLHALRSRNENQGDLFRNSYMMDGGNDSMEAMVETTQRGLVVTRMSNIQIVDNVSQLLTGMTRDGLWLVENGKITKAVRNMRFNDSPLFVLNQVEAIGPAVPVFRVHELNVAPAILPPLKVRDFSFIATADAI